MRRNRTSCCLVARASPSSMALAQGDLPRPVSRPKELRHFSLFGPWPPAPRAILLIVFRERSQRSSWAGACSATRACHRWGPVGCHLSPAEPARSPVLKSRGRGLADLPAHAGAEPTCACSIGCAGRVQRRPVDGQYQADASKCREFDGDPASITDFDVDPSWRRASQGLPRVRPAPNREHTVVNIGKALAAFMEPWSPATRHLTISGTRSRARTWLWPRRLHSRATRP